MAIRFAFLNCSGYLGVTGGRPWEDPRHVQRSPESLNTTRRRQTRRGCAESRWRGRSQRRQSNRPPRCLLQRDAIRFANAGLSNGRAWKAILVSITTIQSPLVVAFSVEGDGTLLGTHGALFRSVYQKTEGKRKATVYYTAWRSERSLVSGKDLGESNKKSHEKRRRGSVCICGVKSSVSAASSSVRRSSRKTASAGSCSTSAAT